MNVSFTPNGLADLHYWVKHDRKAADRILTLLEDVKRDPFAGIGKPEPLKFQLSGCWSRRIDLEHRLVYQINSNEIIVISCRYHY
ncbi:MAG: Txe/YoeB family addiction module toxin [Deltaproteobacteria bacterium]|nr:Txe/YoeB family addiction module toxin [Deltaproteobacteria bacterium]